VRVLLVDNYDSFTYNLFHHLAEVTGEIPTVVRNDDPRWHPALLDAYDGIVLSPGPGDPANARDFGICREVVERARVPLLGICLGHQGLALAVGAAVGRTSPRHGRVSRVHHDGTGVFAGLPQGFAAVRYHSLAVSDLPDELVATAWADDGVLMGIAHRHRPQWGVQFHPESILTEHGHALLANFAGVADRRRAGRPRDRIVTTTAPRAVPTRSVRVLTSRVRTDWSAEVVFEHLFLKGDHAFWLDSGRVDADGGGRFSIMGDASGPLARVATADVRAGTVTVRGAKTEVVRSGFLDWLDQDLRSTRMRVPELPFAFTPGWVGYLGYELKAECGAPVPHHSPDPDAAMVFADRAVVFDHEAGTTHLLALAENDDTAAQTWLDGTAAALATLAGRAARPDPPPADVRGLELRHDHERYLRLVDRCLEGIAAGETYETCLTNVVEVTGDLDPWSAYRYLRRASPAPYGALLTGFGDLSVLSTSPERFLTVGRDGVVESKPIKGTRPRGLDEEEDALLRADLGSSEKDQAENLMIVDLVRNDLGRDAEIGSVVVDELFRVESYATVHQLTSRVRARLRADRTAVDCVRSSFPPGSMTGAPKLRTMEIIDELEGGPRGVYSGAIGWLSPTGAADLSVVIRTALVTPGRVRYGVGGAVIALSDPEAEFQETVVKAAPLLALTAADFPGARYTQPTATV
jgi:para-aminobenzoate synthetase